MSISRDNADIMHAYEQNFENDPEEFEREDEQNLVDNTDNINYSGGEMSGQGHSGQNYPNFDIEQVWSSQESPQRGAPGP